MPNAGRVKFTEKNNYPQGRSGGETKKMSGPATGAGIKHNPTNGGGINRATKGKGG